MCGCWRASNGFLPCTSTSTLEEKSRTTNCRQEKLSLKLPFRDPRPCPCPHKALFGAVTDGAEKLQKSQLLPAASELLQESCELANYAPESSMIAIEVAF